MKNINAITTAVFLNNSKTAMAATVWQYDYGMKLRLQGLQLPAAVEIHFSVQETRGEAITRVGTTQDGVTDVTIPDSLLENDDATRNYLVYAFVYLTDETSGQTEYKVTIPVNSRPRPNGRNKPEDQELFRQAIDAVNAAASRAETAGTTAQSWATGGTDTRDGEDTDNAKYYAQQAKKAVDDAAEAFKGSTEQIETNKTDITALKEEINENGQNVKDLSESVNGIELSKNLLDNSSVIENKRPSNWAGQTINDSYKTDGYYTFRAIPVTQNSTYYFVENGDLVNFGQLATYDKDGKYVSLLSPSVFNVNGVNVGYIIPENVAYVRGESKTSNFSNVNFKLFNGRFEKKFLKYNESAYEGKNLPVIVFDFDQVVEIDARFTILKKYGFAGNVVETATNNYEITKELVKMGYDISPYLGNHTWDYSTEDGIQKLTANIAEKLGGLEAVGIYNPTMISCSGHKYSDTMEKILSSYKIDYVRCSGFIKDGVSLKKSMYENSYGTRIVVPISLGSYNGVDEFNATIDSLVDGNVPLIMPFMHTFGYDADWITQEAFEKVVSHVSDLVKNGKALCMNMHDFVAYTDTVKSIHDDYIRNMSAIFN